MTSTSVHKDATPRAWGVATVQDLWRLSDVAGVPAGTLLATVEKLDGGHAES